MPNFWAYKQVQAKLEPPKAYMQLRLGMFKIRNTLFESLFLGKALSLIPNYRNDSIDLVILIKQHTYREGN